MENNALSVANYFIELAERDSKDLTMLGMMKRIYIAHGFSLAIYDKPLLDSRFDKVEAWRYGPVIPSVYHSFKHHKNLPIHERTVIVSWNDIAGEYEFITPELTDPNARDIVEMVWKRYFNFSTPELVNLTHKDGSPWAISYAPKQNCEIPDERTKMYYKRILNTILSNTAR